jgi:hypothetical protein
VYSELSPHLQLKAASKAEDVQVRPKPAGELVSLGSGKKRSGGKIQETNKRRNDLKEQWERSLGAGQGSGAYLLKKADDGVGQVCVCSTTVAWCV